MNLVKPLLPLALAAACLQFATVLQARSCTGLEMTGTYGYVGSRALFPGIPVTPPGTSGMVVTTPLGELISNTMGGTSFFTVGTLSFDNAGNVLSTATMGAAANIPVGTYTLNQDCTVSVNVNDVFSMNAGGGTGSSTQTATPSATFTGVLMQGGNEIALAQEAPAGSDNGNGEASGAVGPMSARVRAAAAIANGTGATLVLRRTAQALGCTNLNLSGTYGFVSTGGSAGDETEPMPLTGVGRFVADGAGNFVTDYLANNSTNPNLQMTGTYSVNSDCTGTATLKTSSGASSMLRFVLVNPVSGLNSGGPEMDFALGNSGVSGGGVAKPQ